MNKEMEQEKIGMEDILFFLKCYHNKKFHYDCKSLLPSEVMLYKKNLLIDFGQGNEITGPIVKEKIINLFKLCKHHFIQIYIRDIRVHDKDLKKVFKENIRRNNDFGGVHLIEKTYKYSLWDRLFGPKVYSNKWEYNYYLDDILQSSFSLIEDKLDYGDDINMKVFDTYMFCGKTLWYIENIQNKDNKDSQIMLLYEEIRNNIGEKENFGGKITLSYTIDNYIKEHGYFFGIIGKLYEEEILDIDEIYIQEGYVNFVLWRFNNFNKSHFNKMLSSNYSTYEKGILNVNGEKFVIKGEKISELLDLIFSAKEKIGNKISFGELEDIRESKTYKVIQKEVLNYELFHNNLKDKEKAIKDKGLPEKFFGASSNGINLTF